MSLSCDPPQAESFASETLSECVGNHVGRKERGGMMITLDEAKELGKGYKVVPISKEILSDIRTPIPSYSEGCQQTLLYAGKCGTSGALGQIHIPGLRS